MGVTRELNTTAADEEALRRTLTDLERELRDINTTVAHKQQLIDDYLTSGFAGSKLNYVNKAQQHNVSNRRRVNI